MATEKSLTQKVPSPFGREVKFRFVGGKSSGKEIPVIKETFFIGRSGNNNLVLDDRSVSRKHAVLNFIDGHFILSDLNSFKGTKINGEKIQEVELQNGDRIKMGDIVFEFIDGKPLQGKKGNKWLIWAVLFGSIVIVAGMIILSSKNKVADLGADLAREVEYNYSQGVRAFNANKDIESARSYWLRAKELDPDGSTSQGRNAAVLLKNLPSNTGGTNSR
ncbi:MAG: hypothetical protein COV46_02645 [Deltaproteobacteria bacterium CG11_big_fil_rev_8_21_14_0_20_49_13]|nr:MAG: hypothetical protein COV46_02645 [Deltaproteobacteria bacterium CG11_big_fil_rev_8_21_14_0_20_49_13]